MNLFISIFLHWESSIPEESGILLSSPVKHSPGQTNMLQYGSDGLSPDDLCIPSLYLSVHLSVCPTVCLSGHLPHSVFFVCVSLSVTAFVCLFVRLSISQILSLSISLSLSLSLFLSHSLSLSLSLKKKTYLKRDIFRSLKNFHINA